MKNFLRSRDGASKGAALMIVLALVVLLTGLALAYMSRTTTDRQLAQTSYNDTSADLLARSALDIVVGDFKQEILNGGTVTRSNIQPQRSGDNAAIPNLIRRSIGNDPIPTPGVPSWASSVSSTTASANGRSISLARWNSHYLIPRATPGPGQTWDTVYSDPVPSFTPPDWVLVTPQGPTPSPSPSAVIGRYAFAVYDEGGLLDMSLAGYPSWPTSCISATTPTPTPWLVNVGRKGIVAFADLTALASPSPTTTPNVDNIVGWRNYAMTQRSGANFGNFNYSTDSSCSNQDFYGSYLLYFGDPPFGVQSVSDLLNNSLYPFTAVANQSDPSNTRTDQALTTRRELLKLQKALDNPLVAGQRFSQNLLQYMGTFSRERNKPAADWPNLQNNLSEGRFNLNNCAVVIPNPADCFIAHGKKKGWQTGKNKNHLCGTPADVFNLFGLFWLRADILDPTLTTPGHWKYIGNVGPLPPANGNPNPHHGIACFRGANQQNDFFQILNFALNGSNCATDAALARVFGIGASLIDQYDSGGGCPSSGPNNQTQPPGCDLDSHVVGNNWNQQAYATHTTVIEYGHNGGAATFAFGMEPNYSGSNGDTVNGDEAPNKNSNNPHRPCGGQGGNCATNEPTAPAPGGSTQVINHAYSNVGELGYGIDTSNPSLPTLDFSSPNFPDAGVLDFFSYNPISSAYPRAGIVNLYTKNAPVIAAMLARTLQTDAAANVNPSPSPVVSQSQAVAAANAIVTETQNVLAGTPAYGPVTHTDLTRAIAARLVAAGASASGWTGFTTEQKELIARALAEMGQTRTWNLFIDVIAQTGQYAPDATDVTQANKFIVQGEKRYWLHISLGRDLKINLDGTQSNTVDVLGTQLEEVVE